MRQIAENTVKLDANEARYRIVTNSASDAIITIDETGGKCHNYPMTTHEFRRILPPNRKIEQPVATGCSI